MSQIIVLGSGSGFATTDRFNPSVALLAGRHAYIFDCGEPCAALLFRNGIDPLCVRGIFVSHMHADHVGGLAQLLSAIVLPSRSPQRKYRSWSIHRDDDWYARSFVFPPREERPAATPGRIALVVPTEGVDVIREYLTGVYLMDEVLPFDLDIGPISPGPIFADDNVHVSAHPNAHMSSIALYAGVREKHRHLRCESYSFAITVGGKKVVYSGDIESLPELDALVEGADVLILEVAHVAPEDVFPYLRDKRIGRIVLTHIHPALEERVREAMDAAHDERAILAHDGLAVHV